MAATKISDVVVPEVLAKMASAEIPRYCDFLATGLATSDYNNVDIRDGGHFAKVPFYDTLTGADEVITDTTSLTPDPVTTDTDIGVVLHRGKAWASRDLAKVLSGDDPQKEVAKQLAKYWGARLSESMVRVLGAVFYGTLEQGTPNGALSATHLYDIAAGSSTAVPISHTNVLTAMQKVGDEMEGMDVIVVHSKVYMDMLNASMVTFPALNDPSRVSVKDKGKYLGMEIIVSDSMPVVHTITNFNHYLTVIGKKGSLYLGMQKEMMSETDRDVLAFQDVLSSQVHFVPHVKLCKWNDTATNPNNTTLATYSKWTNVASNNKFIRLVGLVTN